MTSPSFYLSLMFMVAAIFVGATVDASKKFFLTNVPLFEGAFAMYLGLALGGTFILKGRRLNPRHIIKGKWIAMASALSVLSSLLSLWVIRDYHLMEYSAILSTTDLWIILGGVLFFKEGLSLKKAFGALLCLGGVIICTKTGAPSFGWASLLMISVVGLTAGRIILAKYILRTDTPEHYLFYTTWPPALGLGLYELFWAESFTFSLPFFCIGLLRYLHKWLHMRALQTVPLSLIGSVAYGEILVASLYGYLLFNRIPDTLSALGASIIVIGILLVLQAQRSLGKTS